MMKTAMVMGLLAAVLCGSATGAEEESMNGWRRDRVVSALGEPRGRLQMGTMELLMFHRGTVKLEDGLVVSSDLLSEDEAALRDERRVREREQDALRREARMRQGLARRQELLANETFMASPARVRVETWLQFSRNYPEVPVDEYLNLARQEWSETEEARREQERLAELEWRVWQAEQTARAAREEASRNRYHPGFSMVGNGWWGGPFYPAAPRWSPVYRYDRQPYGSSSRVGVSSGGLSIQYSSGSLGVVGRIPFAGGSGLGWDRFDHSGTRALGHSF